MYVLYQEVVLARSLLHIQFLTTYLPYQAVTVADLQKALNKYLVRLFDPASSVGCVTTTPSKLAEIAAGFTALHYTVQQTTLE